MGFDYGLVWFMMISVVGYGFQRLVLLRFVFWVSGVLFCLSLCVIFRGAVVNVPNYSITTESSYLTNITNHHSYTIKPSTKSFQHTLRPPKVTSASVSFRDALVSVPKYSITTESSYPVTKIIH